MSPSGSNDSLVIKLDKLFPFHFLLLGYALLFVGLLATFLSPYASPFFLFFGALFVTGTRGLEVNEIAKKYRAFNAFFFIKFGEWKSYDQFDHIFINSSKTSQKVNTMVTTGITARNLEYNAYLKFNDGYKLYLSTKRDKAELLNKVSGFAETFSLDVIDHTA